MASDQLDKDTALKIATTLKLIPGFPWDHEALEEAAKDLAKWCKGAIIDNRVWPAEAQARAVVEEARYWPKWLGTGALYNVFRSKFVPEKAPSNAWKPPVGKLVIDCAECNDTGYVGPEQQRQYCDCWLGVNLKSDLGEEWLESINNTRPRGAKRTRQIARELGVPAAEIIEERFHEFQDRAKTEIANAKKVLEHETASRERKEIARAVIERYDPKKPRRAKERQR